LQLPSDQAGAPLRLLPDPVKLTHGDAYALYEKAGAALPATLDDRQVMTWAKLKPAELPMAQVKSVLASVASALAFTEQAARCQTCNWPAGKITAPPRMDLSVYRKLAALLCVKASSEMAANNHAQALNTLQTTLSMARHLGEAPTLIHGLVGVAITAITCRPIATYGEQAGAPSLYRALSDLPAPFIDLEKLIQAEIDNLDQHPQVNALNKSFFKKNLESTHERVRVLGKRQDRDLAILQCIEALRLHAARHRGALPQSLDQIKDLTVPLDPLHDKPFAYSCTQGTALLESPPPEGDGPKTGRQYEIAIAKSQ